MGCDIHLIAQRKQHPEASAPAWAETANIYEDIPGEFFDGRSYAVFGFLAGVRNYSAITPISAPRGIPDDFHNETHEFREADGYCYYHSRSWLFVQESTEYDYGQFVEDRRYTRKVSENFYDGGATCEPGEGKPQTLREFLGEWYFAELNRLKEAGADRIVFCFGN